MQIDIQKGRSFDSSLKKRTNQILMSEGMLPNSLGESTGELKEKKGKKVEVERKER